MPDPDPQALARAASAAREVIANIRKTQAPAELLDEVTAQLEAIHEKLAPYDFEGPFAQGALEAPNMGEGSAMPEVGDPAEFFPYSPVIGPGNPIAPGVVFERKGEELHAEHGFDAQYCGPPTGVHGGIVALVFDELLGCCNVVNQVGGFTGTLTVRYHSLTPVGVENRIRMRSWIEKREGRKTFTKGTMHFGDRLTAEAEGVFIQPSERARALMRDGSGHGS